MSRISPACLSTYLPAYTHTHRHTLPAFAWSIPLGLADTILKQKISMWQMPKLAAFDILPQVQTMPMFVAFQIWKYANWCLCNVNEAEQIVSALEGDHNEGSGTNVQD